MCEEKSLIPLVQVSKNCETVKQKQDNDSPMSNITLHYIRDLRFFSCYVSANKNFLLLQRTPPQTLPTKNFKRFIGVLVVCCNLNELNSKLA